MCRLTTQQQVVQLPLLPYSISNGEFLKYIAGREIEHKELGTNTFPSTAGFSG